MNALGITGHFSNNASPDVVLACLHAYYRLRDIALQEREHAHDEGWTLQERIALAGIIQDLDVAIASARLWLSRVARRGGRGVPLQAPPAKESVSVQQ